ncbi:hypothetical protein P692DRAFT_2053895 [Suillus brevipes Sb2]|nr:hypothetical protein P692DRAFT_2053895 [Suillus brevipes Sb2]
MPLLVCSACHDHNEIIPSIQICDSAPVLATGKSVGSILMKLRYIMSAHSRGVLAIQMSCPTLLCRPHGRHLSTLLPMPRSSYLVLVLVILILTHLCFQTH